MLQGAPRWCIDGIAYCDCLIAIVSRVVRMTTTRSIIRGKKATTGCVGKSAGAYRICRQVVIIPVRHHIIACLLR